jgi:hypothetical protein
MPTLENRIADLERAQRSEAAPCFWCACEEKHDAESCPHRDWKVTRHENALEELN